MAEDVAELESAAKNYWSDAGYAPGGIVREVDYARYSKGLDPQLQGIKIGHVHCIKIKRERRVMIKRGHFFAHIRRVFTRFKFLRDRTFDLP